LRIAQHPFISIDALEQLLIQGEAAISRIRAHQITALTALDIAQVHTADSARSLQDWMAGRLDVTHESAKTLVDASRLVPERVSMETQLRIGEVSFDRALATAKLSAAGASQDVVEASRGFDLSGVTRLTARNQRLARSR
jgi:hypothetical protein